jgi:hypothetical protein
MTYKKRSWKAKMGTVILLYFILMPVVAALAHFILDPVKTTTLQPPARIETGRNSGTVINGTSRVSYGWADDCRINQDGSITVTVRETSALTWILLAAWLVPAILAGIVTLIRGKGKIRSWRHRR